MVSNLVGGDAAMIELEQLVAGYDGVAITPPLSGMICPGSLTAIVGLNGCGKSTLLKTLAGFLPPVSGRLRWQGTRPVIGWLAQRHALESQFPLNVQDVVSQGAWPGVSLLRGLGGGTRRRIGAVLERVGLAGLAKTPIEALSGGQFQRMLFARVMVQQAPLVMLDEPFTGIDARTTADLLALIRGWHREGRTVVAALHDFAQVRTHFPTTLLIARAPIAWGPTATVLTEENLARARHLSEAWDENAAICRHDDAVADPSDHDHDGHDHHDHSHHGHDHARPVRHEAAE